MTLHQAKLLHDMATVLVAEVDSEMLKRLAGDTAYTYKLQKLFEAALHQAFKAGYNQRRPHP